MKKTIENTITQTQYIFLLISSVIGIGILSAPNSICQDAEQSGWISMLLGSIYPLLISYCIYLNYKYCGNIYFLELNQKLYGKIISKIVFLFMLISFLIYEASVLSGFTNVLNASIASFIPVYLLIFLLSGIVIYTASYGLQSIARLTELIIYFSAVLFFFPLFEFKKGSITNITPIISSYQGIISSIPSSFFAYAGIEIGFLVFPYVDNKQNIKKAGFIATATVTIIYTFFTFLSIYVLGFELNQKIYYPILFIMEIIELPVISDFKTIFIFLWSGLILKTMVCDHFIVSYTFSKLTKLPYRKSCLITWPFVIGLTMFMIPEQSRNVFLSKTIPIMVLLTIIYSIITAIMAKIKGR